MLELFTAFKIIESYSNKESFVSDNNEESKLSIPPSWIIIAILLSVGTAYIAYKCNEYEQPATRALSTIIAFFFSGFYLIYYFIVHVLFDRPCGSKRINNIVRNIIKK
jgi:hypothetical protein